MIFKWRLRTLNPWMAPITHRLTKMQAKRFMIPTLRISQILSLVAVFPYVNLIMISLSKVHVINMSLSLLIGIPLSNSPSSHLFYNTHIFWVLIQGWPFSWRLSWFSRHYRPHLRCDLPQDSTDIYYWTLFYLHI